MPSSQAMQNLCQIITAISFVATGVAGYGVYYFGKRVDAEKGARTAMSGVLEQSPITLISPDANARAELEVGESGWRELRDQYDTCRGMHIRRRLEGLARSYRVFETNQYEAIALLDEYEKPEILLPLWDINRRNELHAFIEEVGRRLHNSVAAAKTLEDHTRNVIKELYADTGVWPEYVKNTRAMFATDPLSKFVRDLRHYTLHHELPILHASLGPELGMQVDDSVIGLDVIVLRRWRRWSPPAAAYLDELEKQPSLKGVLKAYLARVGYFYDGLTRRLQREHGPEFDEMRALYAEIVELEGRP